MSAVASRRGLFERTAIGGAAAVMGAPAAAPKATIPPHRHVEWLRLYFQARWDFDQSEELQGSEEYERLLAEYDRLDELLMFTPPITVDEAAAQLAYVVDACRICEWPEDKLNIWLRGALATLGVETWRPS